jgi:two-component system KDP operon response regulator KdpE
VSEQGRSEPSKRPRVLVVDDEPQIVRALKVVLREAGFEAVPAETASQALDLAAVRPPEAAIVDLVLPDVDGIELTRRLREWSEMPILVLSAVGEEEQKVRALEAGADDYITKPFGSRSARASSSPGCRRRCAAPGARRASRASRSTDWRSTWRRASCAATASRST